MRDNIDDFWAGEKKDAIADDFVRRNEEGF